MDNITDIYRRWLNEQADGLWDSDDDETVRDEKALKELWEKLKKRYKKQTARKNIGTRGTRRSDRLHSKRITETQDMIATCLNELNK